MHNVTIIWERVSGGILTPAETLHLGNIAASPGATEEIEMKVYYSAMGNQPRLINCGLYMTLYSLPYPEPHRSSAYQDWVEVRRWGDLVGLDTRVGLLINLDKQNDYPAAAWQICNSSQGSLVYNPIPVPRQAVKLASGEFHTVDRELPLGATAFFKIKIALPAGVGRTGYRYLGLALEYDT